MISRDQLVRYLNELIPPLSGVDDASNNGLQVEGRDDVECVAFGVDACDALFTAAVKCEADFIVVHHGLSWGDNLKYLRDITARRLRTLFTHGVSLYASHLPLDANPQVGHNAVIARRLGLQDIQAAFDYHGALIGQCGRLPEPTSLSELAENIEDVLGGACRSWSFGVDEIRSVGVVSGGGADAIPEAARRGIDCLVTGEVIHQHFHLMREYELNIIAAGHYMSERPGLEAVMDAVAAEFDVDCRFIDIPSEL